jgi:endonuclease-3
MAAAEAAARAPIAGELPAAGEQAPTADEAPAVDEAPRDRRARAARVLEILDRYVPAPAIPLEHENPFQLLAAVILSAQCTDARVNMVTPALFARAPDAHAMAKLRSTQIQPFIRTCGLSANKARSISAVSRILVCEHGGHVPRDLAALEALPGVGHKTASVVITQAFGEPAFPVDTHIHRLAGRWQLSRARTVEEVEHDLKQLFPRERWSTLHLQFIYFGRQYCTAKGHVPADCPICSWAMSKARALREERQGLSKPLTRPKKPKRTPRARPRRGSPLLATRTSRRRAVATFGSVGCWVPAWGSRTRGRSWTTSRWRVRRRSSRSVGRCPS